MNGYIYKITNPNNKIYIGKTFRLLKRINSYKRLDCKSQSALYNSFIKYGYESHIFEIIEEGEFDNNNLLLQEIKWIKHFNSKNDGLNCTFGGEGVMIGRKHTEFTKNKIRISQTGKKHTEFSKRKISESSKGKNKPLFTETHKEKLSKNKKGKLSNHSINVSAYKITGEYIGTYKSFKECQINLGLKSRISDFIAGRIKHVNGYIFKINKIINYDNQ